MFSALRQGSVVYILEKGENPVLKVGQVVSITQPNYGYKESMSRKSKGRYNY